MSSMHPLVSGGLALFYCLHSTSAVSFNYHGSIMWKGDLENKLWKVFSGFMGLQVHCQLQLDQGEDPGQVLPSYYSLVIGWNCPALLLTPNWQLFLTHLQCDMQLSGAKYDRSIYAPPRQGHCVHCLQWRRPLRGCCTAKLSGGSARGQKLWYFQGFFCLLCDNLCWIYV